MKVNNIGFMCFAEVVLTRLTVQYCEQFTCRHCYVDQNDEIAPKFLRKALCLRLRSWAVGCEFGSDRSVMKGTQRAKYDFVSRLLLEEIPWFVTLFTLHAYTINTVTLVAMSQQ
jgi:hypothetical protein